MILEHSLRRSHRFRFIKKKIEPVPIKDWEAFENCQICRGQAEIDETPQGDLVCKVCKAALPRPQT